MDVINSRKNLPKHVRVSLGSAVVLRLAKAKLDAAPTTAYLMTHRQEKCTANCGFCPQARGSRTRADMLSRVSWSAFETQDVLEGIVDAVTQGKIGRVCIQALNYPQVFDDLDALVRAVVYSANVPISVSCQPLSRENMHQLADAGAERIGIPLDGATKEVFDRIKGLTAGGPYSWGKQWQLLTQATEVFGEDRVSTHFIVGLGETEEEMVDTIQKCVDITVLPALFAFTPIRGTALENLAQPPVVSYRRIQIARHLILLRKVRCENIDFDERGSIIDFGITRERLSQIVGAGEPFLTSGCPNCNRPFYNEKPSGPIYNFPDKPTHAEISAIKKQLELE